mgnify:CR=1 FL=1
MTTDRATVYANGKIEQVAPGTKAGTYRAEGQEVDFVLSNGGNLTFVDDDYRLAAGDRLVVTPRGVAG